MRHRIVALSPFAFALALALLICSAHAQPRIVAYVPNWIDLQTFAPQIDYAKLTHVNIAFENPVNADGELSFNPKNTVLIDCARSNGVKVLISLGGGSAATHPVLQPRYFDLMNATNRGRFVGHLVRYLDQHGVDGLDVDIEGPGINHDYGPFIEELGPALKARDKLLTAALSRGYGGSRVPDSALQHFDFINIMAYDATGPWNTNAPGQHSSFEFATNNVAYWLGRGLPRDKAVLGVPFYGYGFGEKHRRGDQIYSRIIAAHPGAEHLDQIGDSLWHNGLPTIRRKSRYVMDEKLGGVMIWALHYDVADDRSLLKAIHETLRPAATAP